MQLIAAYTKLKELQLPIIATSNAAAYLDITPAHASKLLARLAQAGRIVRLKTGVWGFPDAIDIFALPGYLVAPFPYYVSLQTALYHHGLISQIPVVTYAVSLARTRLYRTPLGDVSIHHFQAEFFFDFDIIEKRNVHIATPEKALIDTLYLSSTKTRLFSSLPELDLSVNFDKEKALQIIAEIKSKAKKTQVGNLFERLTL